MSILHNIFFFIVSIGVLVTFHEFGHYWVARRMGVRVLRFSIGFGRPLWSRRGRDGTEYSIAVFPLGGYVKMFGDANAASQPDGEVAELTPEERAVAFPCQSLAARTWIVAAGPAANFLLAIVGGLRAF